VILLVVSTVVVVLADNMFSKLKGKIPKDDPVVTAIGQGNLKGLETIISKLEADPEAKAKATQQTDNNGRTSLMRAAYVNLSESDKIKDADEVRAPMVGLLLAHGAPLDAQDHDGWTALMWAAWSGMPKVVDLLLEHGANLALADRHGNTALHIAAERGQAEIVKALLAKGADKNLRNQAGQTALADAEKGLAEHPARFYGSKQAGYHGAIALLQ
jgi:hypothetical protein